MGSPPDRLRNDGMVLWRARILRLQGTVRHYRLEVLAACLLLMVLLAIGWPLWLHEPHWPTAWKAFGAGAAILLTLLVYTLLGWMVPARAGDARPRCWRALQAIAIGALTALACLHWWHAHPWSAGRHALTEHFICKIAVPAHQLDAETRRVMASNGPAAGAACWPVAIGQGSRIMPILEANTPMLASHQWVQCAPAGPRRCVSVAWLSQRQHDRLQTAGLSTAEVGTASRAAPGDHEDQPAGSAGKNQKPGDLDQTLASIATVLAVVLTVTTLIATKTATDARNEVRDELDRLDAGRQAQAGALQAQFAMLATMMLQTQQRLVQQYYRKGAPLLADATLLVSLVRPLTQVLYGLSGLASGRGDMSDLQGKADKLLDQLQLQPLRNLPSELLDGPTRGLLRDTAGVLTAHRSLLDRSGRSFTETENGLRDALSRLAQKLDDV